MIGRAFSTLEHRASAGPFSAGEIASLARAFDQTRITNVAAFALIGERAMTIPYFRMTQAEYTRLTTQARQRTQPGFTAGLLRPGHPEARRLL